MTCPPALFPETQVCSGRGVGPCLETQLCTCDDVTWTGRGDFLYGGPTCAINIAAIRVLYGLLALVSLAALFASLLYIKLIVRYSAAKGRGYSVLGMGSAIAGIVAALAFVILGLYRVALPLNVVGTDLAATLLFNIGAAAFTLLTIGYDCSLFLLGFAHAGIVRERIDRSLISRVRIYIIIHIFLAVYCILCVFFMLLQTARAFEILVPMFFTTYAVLMFFMVCVFITASPMATQKIRQKAGDRAKDGVLKEILIQIDQLTSSARISCIFATSVAVLFGAWAGARYVAFPYIFPVIYILGEVWQVQCMLTLHKVSGLAVQHSNPSDLPRRSGGDSTQRANPSLRPVQDVREQRNGVIAAQMHQSTMGMVSEEGPAVVIQEHHAGSPIFESSSGISHSLNLTVASPCPPSDSQNSRVLALE